MARNKKPGRSIRKKTATPRRADLLPRAAQELFWEAVDLAEEGRHVEALEILENLDHQYPDRIEILSELYNASVKLSDLHRMERTALRLSRLRPEDPEIIMALAAVYLAKQRLALACKTFRHFVEGWPDHERTPHAREMLAAIEAKAKEVFAESGLAGDGEFEAGELHEESISLMDWGEYSAARATLAKLLGLRPHLPSAENNLSLIAMCENNLEGAIEIAEGTLSRNPNNYHTLSNLVRFSVLRGEIDKARLYTDRLRAIDESIPDLWIKKAEALSYLSDDAGMLEVLREAEKAPWADLDAGVQTTALIYHLGAVSTLRLGPAGDAETEQEAKRLWGLALKIWPGFEIARSNLADLRRPIGERQGPWPFSLNELVRQEIGDELADQLKALSKTSKKNDQDAIATTVRSFLARRPELNSLIPVLLERGDPAGRSFALTVASLGATPELLTALEDFVFTGNGPDQIRIQAAQTLVQHERIQPGHHRLWVKGRWEQIFIMGALIHGEPVSNVGKKAEPLSNRAVLALQAGDGEKAETLIRQALLIEPDNPMLINNLVSSLQMQGRAEEVEEMARELFQRFPDYFMGRTNMAKLAIRKGDLDRAREYLAPLYQRRRLHFAEYAAFASIHIELALAGGDRREARQWFEQLEKIYPDAPNLEYYRVRVQPPSWASYISPGGR